MSTFDHIYRKRILLICIVLFLPMFATSCITLRSLFGGEIEIKVTVDEKANVNSATRFDILLVYDETLLATVSELTAKDWFEKKYQISRDYPGDSGFDVWNWEWSPGQEIKGLTLPLRSKALACIIFADYNTPGTHRLKINPHYNILVELGEREFNAISEE